LDHQEVAIAVEGTPRRERRAGDTVDEIEAGGGRRGLRAAGERAAPYGEERRPAAFERGDLDDREGDVAAGSFEVADTRGGDAEAGGAGDERGGEDDRREGDGATVRGGAGARGSGAVAASTEAGGAEGCRGRAGDWVGGRRRLRRASEEPAAGARDGNEPGRRTTKNLSIGPRLCFIAAALRAL